MAIFSVLFVVTDYGATLDPTWMLGWRAVPYVVLLPSHECVVFELDPELLRRRALAPDHGQNGYWHQAGQRVPYRRSRPCPLGGVTTILSPGSGTNAARITWQQTGIRWFLPS